MEDMALELATRPGAALQVRFPDAQAVFALGRFNNWSTTATPLRTFNDGVWEAILPPGTDPRELCFFVLRPGERFGRIVHGGTVPDGRI